MRFVIIEYETARGTCYAIRDTWDGKGMVGVFEGRQIARETTKRANCEQDLEWMNALFPGEKPEETP